MPHGDGAEWTCPDDDGASYLAKSGLDKTEIIMQCNTVHIDGPDADITPIPRTAVTWQGCANQCVENINGYVFFWNLNTSCYLRGVGSRQASMEKVWGGYTNRFWDPPEKLGTPAFNVFSQWKSNMLRSFTYSREWWTDRMGGDLDVTNITTTLSFDHCAQSCADVWDQGCRGFVWRSDIAHENYCYRKFSINGTFQPDNYSSFGFLSLINPDDTPLTHANLTVDDPRSGIYNSFEPQTITRHQNLTELCGDSTNNNRNIKISP